MAVAVILVAVEDPSVRAALADDLGHRFTPDYDGLEVSSSWARDQLDALADAGRNVALVLAATDLPEAGIGEWTCWRTCVVVIPRLAGCSSSTAPDGVVTRCGRPWSSGTSTRTSSCRGRSGSRGSTCRSPRRSPTGSAASRPSRLP